MPLLRAVPAGTFTAALVWAAVLVTAPRYLRHRGDIRLTAFWYTEVLLALALTFVIPPVYLAFDRLVGLTNAARWLSHACVLGGAYLLDTFFYALTHGTRRLTWHRPWFLSMLLLSIAGLASLLWQADLPEQSTAFDFAYVSPLLVVYRAVYVAFLGLVLVRMTRSAARYRRQAPDELVQIGMALLVVGGFWGLGYCVFAMAVALTPATASWTPLVVTGVSGMLFLSVIFVIAGATIPEWGRRIGIARWARHLHALRAYERLGPFWYAMSRAFPIVVLPMSLTTPAMLFRPRELELHLHRRVIEILDARRLLLTREVLGQDRAITDEVSDREHDSSAAVTTTSSAAGSGVGLNELPHLVGDHPVFLVEAWSRTAESIDALNQPARFEAQMLRAYLRYGTVGAGAFTTLHALYQPHSYEEALVYLERVALALRASGLKRSRERRVSARPHRHAHPVRTGSADE